MVSRGAEMLNPPLRNKLRSLIVSDEKQTCIFGRYELYYHIYSVIINKLYSIVTIIK